MRVFIAINFLARRMVKPYAAALLLARACAVASRGFGGARANC
jgi:hypothetical protein